MLKLSCVPVSPTTPSWIVLDAKHPPGQPALKEALLSPSAATSSFHPVVFEALNGVAIHCTALHTKGAVGPSEVDTFCWWCLYLILPDFK